MAYFRRHHLLQNHTRPLTIQIGQKKEGLHMYVVKEKGRRIQRNINKVMNENKSMKRQIIM